MQEETTLRQQELSINAAVAPLPALRHKKRARYVVKPFGSKFHIWDTARACVPFQYISGFEALAACEEVVAKLSKFSEQQS